MIRTSIFRKYFCNAWMPRECIGVPWHGEKAWEESQALMILLPSSYRQSFYAATLIMIRYAF